MPRWIILAILRLVVLGRSAILVFVPESSVDADQVVQSDILAILVMPGDRQCP